MSNEASAKTSVAQDAKADGRAQAAKPDSAPPEPPRVNVMTQVNPVVKVSRRPWLAPLLVLLGLTAFLMLLAGVRLIATRWPPSPRLVVVPKSDLPVYYQLRETDVKSRIHFAGRDEAETLTKTSDIVGRYTLQPLGKEKPIAEAQLGSAIGDAQFAGKTAVEIALPVAAFLNGMPKAGDTVDLAFTLATAQGQQPQTSKGSSFQNVFVLNLKTAKSDPSTAATPEKPYVLVVALPTERQEEFQSETLKNAFVTVRKKDMTR
jgi:hypothetical protein